MVISSKRPHVVHVLPTMGRSGYGVTAVVEGLLSAQRERGQSVNFSTTDSPLSLSCESQIEIVHQHMIWLRHSCDAQSLARKSCAPLVVAPHGALDPWARSKSYWKKKLVWYVREFRYLQAVQCLHATSPFEINYFRELGLTQPIAMIPNGLDLRRHPVPGFLEASAFLAKHPELKGKRCVLFLSRITAQKGLIPFLQAFENFQAFSSAADWHFLLAGSDQDGYLQTIRDHLAHFDLLDKVTILPPLYGADKQQAMAFAEVFVLPSLAEGFPMVVLEALAAGLPVISTTASPWMCLPGQNAGWWVEPTTEDLLCALKELCALSPCEIKAMGVNARALVEQSFGLPEILSQYDALYSWLLGVAPRPEFVHV